MDPREMPAHWKVLLDGYGEEETGDVLTRDGEVLGTWGMIDGALYTFTPEGESEELFIDPHIWPLTQRIWDWHQAQNTVPAEAGVGSG